MKKAVGLWLVLAALGLLLSACMRESETEEENRFALYYPAALELAAGEDAIVTRSVEVEGAGAMTAAELAQCLLESLFAASEEETLASPVPSGTTVLSLSVHGSWAQVDLSRHYARLAGIDLTLADYCIALTLTQLEEINAVSITSGGRELPYRKTQTLTAADPLLSGKEDALRPITMSLYFLDRESGELRAERQAVALYEGQTRVNALLEALARGPESEGLEALVPEEFTVLSSRVEEGICYLNLAEDAQLGERPEMALAALTASLCSLDYIEAVQFVVDGEILPELFGVDTSEPLAP